MKVLKNAISTNAGAIVLSESIQEKNKNEVLLQQLDHAIGSGLVVVVGNSQLIAAGLSAPFVILRKCTLEAARGAVGRELPSAHV